MGWRGGECKALPPQFLPRFMELPSVWFCLVLSGHAPLSRDLAVPSGRCRKVKLKLLLLLRGLHVFYFALPQCSPPSLPHTFRLHWLIILLRLTGDALFIFLRNAFRNGTNARISRAVEELSRKGSQPVPLWNYSPD